MNYLDTKIKATDFLGAAMVATKPARAATGFIRQNNSNLMDFACAVGCATFSMGVFVGVYFLLDSL
ncbi:hypothetical protein WJ542_31595 [Paraburkholderia sp. B3]|uniref:hypothetical protein n=1 Tax=Paraburkholderia sp. B3 TaxID=3134791 RepID=UPI00398291A5